MSLTLLEARTRAATLQVSSYDVALDLVTDRSHATFGSRTRIRFAASAADESFVELAGARELSVTLNGARVPEEAYDGERIRLQGLRGDNELLVEAVLPTVTDGDGMHRFTDPADGETYLSAYLGMDLARKVFACFDQLDLKAPITLGVSADPAWTVLANGRAADHADGQWAFAPTAPIPPNLFVVCAGPWHSVRWEHAGLPFGWHARRSLAAELDRDADELRRVTTACFDHYTGIFDEPYPFDSYDQVMVPELNWGAQEMPGCVTFRDELLFRSGAPRPSGRCARWSSPTRWRTCGSVTWPRCAGGRTPGSASRSPTTWASRWPHERPGSPAPGWRSGCRRSRRPTAPTPAARRTRWPRAPRTSSTWTPASATSTRSPTPRATRCCASWSPGSARTPSWPAPTTT
jgi:hypothetical protein